MMSMLESRLRGALWGMFAGDALASPSHWYYGGFRQIQSDYGPNGLTDYEKPVKALSGSILNKSNTNGGGRGSFRKVNGISIVGDVINHGKREYWDPSRSVHYHATLNKGENTLELQLVRVLMKSIVATGGTFDADHFRQAYIDFMTTPGSHNDTYASTCHRMFFANLKLRNMDPKDCPDNDQHNVDTIDGLILPTVTALAYASRGKDEEGAEEAGKTAAVTRNSSILGMYSGVWSDLISSALRNESKEGIDDALRVAAKGFGLRRAPRSDGRDEMSACYLDGSVPTLLDMIAKYDQSTSPSDPAGNDSNIWTGLLANANVGGENVHRGSLLGAVLGARAGVENIPSQMIDGLYDKEEISLEIDAFVTVVMAVTNADNSSSSEL